MPRKSPAEWSSSYRKRIESYVKRNPHTATLDSARGHKKPEPVFLPHQSAERNKHVLEKVDKNLDLRGKVGMLRRDEVKTGKQLVNKMRQGINNISNLTVGTVQYEVQRAINKQIYIEMLSAGAVSLEDDGEISGNIFYH